MRFQDLTGALPALDLHAGVEDRDFRGKPRGEVVIERFVVVLDDVVADDRRPDERVDLLLAADLEVQSRQVDGLQ